MPCDVPCVVDLGPPPRGKAQTQPPLVGANAQSLPSALLDGGWGLGQVSTAASRTDQGWSIPGRGFVTQIWALPAWSAQCPALTGQGLGRPSLFRLIFPSNQTVSLVSFRDRGRKVHHREECTFNFQPQAEKKTGRLTTPATPWTVVSGCGAFRTSPSCFCLHLLGSCHALPTSHCVRAFLSV